MSVSVLDYVPDALDAMDGPRTALGASGCRLYVVSPHVVVRAGVEAMLVAQPGRGQSHQAGRAARRVTPALPVRGAAPHALGHARRTEIAFIDSMCLDTPLVEELAFALEQPTLVVLVLARADDPVLTDRALEMGADGCLALDATRAELVSAIAAARRRQLHAVDAPHVVDYRLNPYPAPSDCVTDSLTARELEVLALIARGFSNEDIATKLFVSRNTVKTYIRLSYRKIGARSRTQATLWGIEHRVSDLERRARLGDRSGNPADR